MKARTLWTAALLTGAMVTGFGMVTPPTRPTPFLPGDRCIRCDRLITDRWVGGQTTGGVDALKFRTVRCMLTYLRGAPAPYKKVWVSDGQTGKLIDPEKAVFVPVPIDTYTGEHHYGLGEVDYVAFRDAKTAEAVATTHGVQTMTWAAVQYYAAWMPVTVPEAQR